MASRKEQKAEARRQREERERAAAAAARRRRTLAYVGAGGLVAAAAVALVVVLLAGGSDDGGSQAEAYPDGSLPARHITELEPAAKAAGCTLKRFPDYGSRHVPGKVTYRTNPPTSGDHFEIWASDGAHTKAPPTERLVHSLEHGRVIFQFRSSVPASVRGDLKALFDEDPHWVLLTPNATGMPFEVAATAWRQLLGCPRTNPQVFDAMRAFRTRYRDRGPEPAGEFGPKAPPG